MRFPLEVANLDHEPKGSTAQEKRERQKSNHNHQSKSFRRYKTGRTDGFEIARAIRYRSSSLSRSIIEADVNRYCNIYLKRILDSYFQAVASKLEQRCMPLPQTGLREFRIGAASDERAGGSPLEEPAKNRLIINSIVSKADSCR